MEKTKLEPVGNSALTVYVPSTGYQYTLSLINVGDRQYEFALFSNTEGRQILKHTGSSESCLEEFLYWCHRLHEDPESTLEIPQ